MKRLKLDEEIRRTRWSEAPRLAGAVLRAVPNIMRFDRQFIGKVFLCEPVVAQKDESLV
jgi:hypothetical protein